jgi:hypothetical protein
VPIRLWKSELEMSQPQFVCLAGYSIRSWILSPYSKRYQGVLHGTFPNSEGYTYVLSEIVALSRSYPLRHSLIPLPPPENRNMSWTGSARRQTPSSRTDEFSDHPPPYPLSHAIPCLSILSLIRRCGSRRHVTLAPKLAPTERRVRQTGSSPRMGRHR